MNIKQKVKNLIFPKQKLPIQESINPYTSIWRDLTEEEIRHIAFVKDYTMTSVERLVALSRSIDYLINNNIDGDIVECGVWRGGSMMLVAKKLLELKSVDKKLFLFDTFDGMPTPGEDDISWENVKAKEIFDKINNNAASEGWCHSKLEEVKLNMTKTLYPNENVFFIKGKVEETLPLPVIEKIALLRLDTDWYDSTKHELECLYDKLSVGGVLIIDDYGHWQGAKMAVDEFIKNRELKIYLNRIDYTGRLAIKIS